MRDALLSAAVLAARIAEQLVKKLHRLIVVFAIALGIAAPAAAQNNIAPPAPAFDLRDEIATPVQTLPMFVGTSAFDEVAHVDLPSPSIADELARRFAAADVQPPSELAIFSPTVSRKLALGPLGVFEENNVNEQSELGRELHLGLGYVRNRWFDPTTGTWLSPDPKGYVDSSNLYAFAGGDPVNGRDPLGEQVARPASRPAPRQVVHPPQPGQRGPVIRAPRTPTPYAPGGWGTFRNATEAAKASRPKGAGARAFRGRTADELTETEQQDFLEHQRRLKSDPAYRAQWEMMAAGTLELQAELLHMPLPAVGGAGGGDDGGDDNVSGWRVGDPITKLTRAGRAPVWNTQRARYWKNEAAKPGAEAEYGATNVARMQKGLAPQRYNFFTGQMESKELSHEPVPQREGGTRVVPRWPGDHAARDEYRNTGNTRAIVKNGNE